MAAWQGYNLAYKITFEIKSQAYIEFLCFNPFRQMADLNLKTLKSRIEKAANHLNCWIFYDMVGAQF